MCVCFQCNCVDPDYQPTTTLPITAVSSSTTWITCDGSKIPFRPDHTFDRQDASTSYEAPGQRLGNTLVFPCSQGYHTGTVTYICGEDGTFQTTDR